MGSADKTRFALRLIAALVLAGAAAGCASLGQHVDEERAVAYVVEGDDPFSRHAPVFVHQNGDEPHNRIGRPSAARDADGKERVFVDPAHPVIYVERRRFTSSAGREYTNLVYRAHFEKVPVSLIPFHVSAGPSGGLFVIATLDASARPVLYTTVHTCGCYLAFVPTELLAEDAYPDNWPAAEQKVFGERLASRVGFAFARAADERLLVVLRDGTHRVMAVDTASLEAVHRRYRVVPVASEPVAALRRLPLDDGTTTSFFHTEGPRSGYVRDVSKPFELLLVSWWALDPRVGIDKDYGDTEETDTVFYTSLKPWRRHASDMENFAAFLDYWGWRL